MTIKHCCLGGGVTKHHWMEMETADPGAGPIWLITHINGDVTLRKSLTLFPPYSLVFKWG